jgi:hypothetical protein
MTAPTISSLTSSGQPPTAGNSPPGVGNAGQGGTLTRDGVPIPGINDLFAQLKEFGWGGVTVPVTEFETEIRQDLVIHKFVDRNGAYVEGTGRHPTQITATIPFLNNIFSAANESWPQGNLYPYQWRNFLLQCLDGKSKTLQHPELGPLNCKIDVSRTRWSSKTRDGVWMTATWIESDDSAADQLGVDLSQASPIGQLTSNADDLDQQFATLQAAVTLQQQGALPAFTGSFSNLAAAIVGVIDTTTVLQKEYQGQCDNLINQCNVLENALMLSSQASPLNWPIIQNCEQMKASAYALKATPAVANNNGTGVLTNYTVQKDSTMAQLASQLGSDLASFLVLNAPLVAQPVVPAGTVVQYYQSAA